MTENTVDFVSPKLTAVVNFRSMPNGAYKFMRGNTRGFWRLLVVRDVNGPLRVNSANVVQCTNGPEGISGVTERSGYCVDGSRSRFELEAARLNARHHISGRAALFDGMIIQAPRGYHWDRDANGVRIVRNRDGADYHPTCVEVEAGIKGIIAKLDENAKTRRAAADKGKHAAKIIKQASRHGTWVCIADSRKAGNCDAGSRSYASRHGLDVSRHYPVSALPAVTAEESSRVALAVLAAQRRQVADMQRGYSELA